MSKQDMSDIHLRIKQLQELANLIKVDIEMDKKAEAVIASVRPSKKVNVNYKRKG